MNTPPHSTHRNPDQAQGQVVVGRIAGGGQDSVNGDTSNNSDNADSRSAKTSNSAKSHSIPHGLLSWPVLGGLFLILLSVALAVPWLLAQHKTQAIEGAQNELQKQIQHLQDQLSKLQSKIGLQAGQLAELKSKSINIERLYQSSGNNREDLILIEIEHALTLGSQQLQLAANVPMALLALEDADVRLARLEHPRFIYLRRVLGRAIERLRAASAVDIPGMSLRLENVLISMEHLPLSSETLSSAPENRETIASEEPSDWQQKLWQETKSLLQLRKISKDAAPILLPEQNFFLRENMKMRLLSARLALLSRDQWTFRSELDIAVKWLQRFFDQDHRGVRDTVATLNQLAKVQIRGDIPGLSEVFSALRRLQTSGTREKSNQ